MSHAGFVKLSTSILTSTVWGEDSDTRIVWITLLAMADSDGVVQASIPGLAHTARVPREATERALNLFLAPDPDSRTPDHDGRRIEQIPGGWVVLNYPIYRKTQEKAEAGRAPYYRAYRLQKREKPGIVAQHVAQQKLLHGVAECCEVLRASTEEEEEQDKECVTPSRVTWLTPYVEVWAEYYPLGDAPTGIMAKTLRKLDEKHGAGYVCSELRSYLWNTATQYISLPKFAAGFGSWGGAGPDPDEPPPLTVEEAVRRGASK